VSCALQSNPTALAYTLVPLDAKIAPTYLILPTLRVVIRAAKYAYDQLAWGEQDSVWQLGALDHVIVPSTLAVTPWSAVLCFSRQFMPACDPFISRAHKWIKRRTNERDERMNNCVDGALHSTPLGYGPGSLLN
jgi:hypothetical protein